MIYTIRCRRGHCGSRFQTDDRSPSELPTNVVGHMEREAEVHGWRHDNQGWLCPFDAPKPAANETSLTRCGMALCHNANLESHPAVLMQDGWHLVNVGEGGVKDAWFCPACWKTTQPEPSPDPIEELEDLEREAAERRQEMRKVAKEEIGATFTRIKRRCAAAGDSYAERMALLIDDECTEIPF